MRIVLSNGYRHDDNEVGLRSIQRRAVYTPRGEKATLTITWNMDGYLHGSSVTDLGLKIRAMELAYTNDGFEAVLLDNNGRNSAHKLGDGLSRAGCRVVGGVNWGWESGAEYTTFRSYSIQLEADYDSPFVDLFDFNESITRVGTCGPKKIWKPALNAKPQLQYTWASTTQRVIQRGRVVGLYRYIAPPPPYWPAAEHLDQREQTEHSPRHYGPYGRPAWREYAVDYQYVFESDVPLLGSPKVV